MKDQAEKLRQLVNKINRNESNSKAPSSKIFAITSGKGGVGKSNFTINLAISLSKLGYNVIVFDADIGFANIDVISGIIPKYTIADVISGSKKITEIIYEGPGGVKLISGGSGINELFTLSNKKLELLTTQLLDLENFCDYLLIDTSAGFSEVSLSFLNASEEVILITTPEPTSLTDGYAMIKTLSKANPNIKIKIIINRVKNEIQSNEVFNKLKKVTDKFLNFDIENLGYIYDSKIVTDSVMNQIPFVISNPNSNVSKKMNQIALSVIGLEYSIKENYGFRGFINNFKEFIYKGRK